MVLSTEWSQVEVIDLLNDGNGLGFILVGGKSTGVVIKALTPGGIAERDGRMQCGDHVLQIGEVNLRGFSSEQAATVLRQTGPQVRLIVARPVEPTSPDYQALASHAPIIPTKLLTDPEELERQLIQTAAFSGPFFSAQDAMLQAAAAANAAAAAAEQMQIAELQKQPICGQIVSPGSLVAPAMYSPNGSGSFVGLGADGNCGHSSCGGYESESSAGGGGIGICAAGRPVSLPETECFDVVLHRNVYGLGIRVAGYVCEEEDLSGIFVKSMVEGGAGEAGCVRINDRILAVDGKSVAEATNHEAVTLLKNSGISVHLRIERFLRGRKYEHLQVALNDMKEVNISTMTMATAASSAATPDLMLEDGTQTMAATTTTPTQMRLMVGSDTMQSMAQLSLPPSPSCVTLTWVAPQTDVDSLATVDIDYPDEQLNDKQIEAEFESHTTIDSDVFVVQYNANGSSPAISTGTGSTPSPTTPQSPAVSSFDLSHSPVTPPPGLPLSASTAHMLELFPTLPANPRPKGGNGSDSSDEGRRRKRQHRQKQSQKQKRQPTVRHVKGTTGGWSPSGAIGGTEYADSQIIVANLNKLAGLGISLEGTVDVENGVEVRPHHFIRSILDESPVGLDGTLRPGDEILQLNEHRLHGLRHTEVVKILKELPDRVRMVCARGPRIAPSQMGEAQQRQREEWARNVLREVDAIACTGEQMEQTDASDNRPCASTGKNKENGSSCGARSSSKMLGRMSKAQSESSLYTGSATGLEAASACDPQHRRRSRSMEHVSGLALWSNEVVYVELQKTEYGFGFSVLDYQDPLDVDGTVIVVRGLIPGGAAESSQQLFPGDRIVSVGGVKVQGKSLDDAVLVLKGMPLGQVRIGLCRPLPALSDELTDGDSTPT